MNFIEACKNEVCDTTALSNLVYLWLVNAGGMGSTWIAEAAAFYELEQEALDTLSDIKDVYNLKTSQTDKLRYAHTVEHIIELMATRDNYFQGRTFPISEAIVNAALEI